MAMTNVDHLPCPGATTKFGKKIKTGVLYIGQHAVLKPVHNCLSGRREVDFYNTVFQQRCDDDNDDVISTLKNLLPRFLGIEERGGVRHIKLENTLSRFRKPCMIDIKMGHVTSDPYAWPEKVAQRRSKYPYAEKLGFTLSGMTVYNPNKGEFEKTDKYTCHNFPLNQVISEGLSKFFGFPGNPRKDVILCLLHKLQTIKRWFLRQRHFVFYASSLFIVYEGSVQDGDCHPVTGSGGVHCCRTLPGRRQNDFNHLKPLSELCDNLSNGAQSDKNEDDVSISDFNCCTGSNQCSHSVIGEQSDFPIPDSIGSVADTEGVDCSLVDVRLIDFTHAFRTTERDDNYLSGLDTLIKILSIMYTWE